MTHRIEVDTRHFMHRQSVRKDIQEVNPRVKSTAFWGVVFRVPIAFPLLV